MQKISQSQLIEALNWRYAVKAFDATKKISADDWKSLQESLRLAPSSYGLQPWKFILVENPAIRKELRSVSWNQSQVEDSSHFIVFATLEKMSEPYIEKYIQRHSEVTGASLDSLKGFQNAMVGDLVKGPRAQVIDVWAQRQAYIAMGHLNLAAALLQIDTCCMEGLDPKAYDKILKLEGTGYKTVAAVACGYRSETDKLQHNKKVRFQESDVFEVR